MRRLEIERQVVLEVYGSEELRRSSVLLVDFLTQTFAGKCRAVNQWRSHIQKS